MRCRSLVSMRVYMCICVSYRAFPWQSFHSALFILLSSCSAQPQYSGLDLEVDYVASVTGDHHLKACLAKANQHLSLSGSFAQILMNLDPSGSRILLANGDKAEVPVGSRMKKKILPYSSRGEKGLSFNGKFCLQIVCHQILVQFGKSP